MTSPNIEKLMMKEDILALEDYLTIAKAEYLKLIANRYGGNLPKMIEVSKISRASFYRMMKEVQGLPYLHSVQAEHQARSNFRKH